VIDIEPKYFDASRMVKVEKTKKTETPLPPDVDAPQEEVVTEELAEEAKSTVKPRRRRKRNV